MPRFHLARQTYKTYNYYIDDISDMLYTPDMVLATPPTTHVSIREAALRLGVHENTVRHWMDKQILRSYRLPTGIRRLPETELARVEAEMFAVPTSFYDPPTTKAPVASASDLPDGPRPS